MRQMCRVVIAIALVTAALRGPALGGHNYLAKLAVHVKAHGTSCADGLPTFTTCSQVNTTYFPLGDVDIIPVFFDLNEYTEVGLALMWPAEWGSMAWTRCKGDIQTGTLAHPHDFARIGWSTCQTTWSVALGYGWLQATSPGLVGPSNLIYPRVADCQPTPEEDFACKVLAGVGGYIGDDACGTDSDIDRSTWGAIKSIFSE